MSKVFVVDIDGVVCNHANAICEFVNNKFGINSQVDDVTSWDHDFGPISFVKAVEETYCREDFILGMPVELNAGWFLKDLAAQFEVILASARKPVCHAATRKWVEQNFGNFEVIFPGSKTDIQAHFLVDDNIDEVISFTKTSGCRTSFLFKRPWNNNADTARRLLPIPNCSSVVSFREIIEQIKGN
ncbi:MAG TPA: hypothetical protein PL033_12815 [Candidatus Brocadiia bacterium]|nr:hypothetical protein [Candidatus Brocadiia bacterium]